VPLSAYPTSRWRVGQVINPLYDVPLDPLLPTGTYTVQFNVLDASGRATWEQDVQLGTLEVYQPARSFDLPGDIQHPLNVQLGESMVLKGYTLKPAVGAMDLTLYWQADARPEGNYVVFVHALDAEDNVIAQADRLLLESGQITSGWAVGQVAVDQYSISLPANVSPDTVRVGVGLYDADHGNRLKITLPDGTHPANDRLILGE
jgi:hypothetical protein